jgi:hypothetical protein
MQKKLKLSSDESSKKCKQGYGGTCGGVWQSLHLVAVWSQTVSFVLVFGRNLDSVTMKMFSHLIYFIKKFYKFCTFNTICKDHGAINCITIQHKKGSFPSTLTLCYTSIFNRNHIIHKGFPI